MRKHISLSNKHYLGLWGIFHGIVAVMFLAAFIFHRGDLSVDADLFNMLPKPFMNESVLHADEKLTEANGQNVFILVCHEDFEEAKNIADRIFVQLKDSPKFKSFSLYQSTEYLSEVSDYIYKYRWNLLSDEDIDLINSDGGAEIFAQNALAKAYGAFNISSMENLELDPFLLSENAMLGFLSALQNSGTAMSLKDGVLASNYEGNWYVMLRGILSKEGAALASKSNAVATIYEVCRPIEAEGVRLIYSGTPFHSYKSSMNAMFEIKLISTVSLLAVLIMLLVVFRSPLPLAVATGSILLSVGTGFLATVAVFKKIHVLSLVFGTSLIGSCIDYSLHFFINWKANRQLKSGAEVRKYIFAGLTISLISTLLCYFILVFAPFNLLKQISCFSLSGFLSTYLTVLCVYPLVPFPKESTRHLKLASIVVTPKWYNRKIVGRAAVAFLFVFGNAAVFLGFNRMKIKNDVSTLYIKEGRVLEDEIAATNVLRYRPTGWFFVRGATEDEVIEREEEFVSRLQEKIGNVPIVHTSSFVPSIEKQKRSREAAKKLLALSEIQYEYLGYDPTYAIILRAEFMKSESDFISISENVPSSLLSQISSVWLGKLDDDCYSVVLPASMSDREVFLDAAKDDENIYFIDKMSDISRDLDTLTQMILKLFAVAYVLIFIVLKFFYKTKQSIKVISIPLLIIMMTSSVFAIADIHLEFFSITGMILVFGLGLDYVIYMIESERRKEETEIARLEPFAILLSFFTTAISFGALALSSFKPVHLLGLSIFIGLATAYFSSFFYARTRIK